MKILISLTYFEPYHSGLSAYAFRLAQGLAKRGHEVVVLTSAYNHTLAKEEEMAGFRIIRVPVSLRLSKGVIMLGLTKVAKQWIKWADVVNLHLPQFESAFLASLAKGQRKPLVTTWHCDLEMQGNLFGRLAGRITNKFGSFTLRNSNAIIQNSLDYARSSIYLMPYLNKVKEIETPIDIEMADARVLEGLKRRLGVRAETRMLGLAGRVAREKGYEYLASALPSLLAEFPDLRVVHAGMWQGVVGEQAYQKSIEKMIQQFGSHWISLGFLSDEEFRAFFAMIDVLVFSSFNRTESFGIVQVEALAQGTPIVASDLPGVRQPVLRTGLGAIVPPGDFKALTEQIKHVLRAHTEKVIPTTYLQAFDATKVAQKYESIFEKVIHDARINRL